ncbi:MAG: glutaminyl-peptide cyclotransferase [Janthinobacterium lividum]
MLADRSRIVRRCGALALAAFLSLGTACAAPVFGYTVVARYPHSTASYTEGFFFLNGTFYEGTGLQGQSEVLAIDPETGKPRQRASIPPPYFGEGVVDWGSNILEWTWQSHTGFVLDRFSLRTLKEFHYTGEGWGMTRTNKELITSDGSSTLRFRNPNTFAETRHIDVKDGSAPIEQLNELEYVKGEIYANVWHSDRIARISPRDGHVLSWIDLTGLMPQAERVSPEAVLNGIAYDAQHDRLFVTGKQWPWVFEIKVLRMPH